MMLHQDDSAHEWAPGRWWDLIVTMDDATSDIHSAFFVEEEGTMSTFQELCEVVSSKGLFCALYADRASHYWRTPEAGAKVDKDNPTQAGRALKQLGIELIPAYSPEPRGRSERMFGTLQKRLPQELRLVGITTMDEANRFLRETFLPDHNRRFAIAPEAPGSAFVPFAGNLDDILCIQEERTVAGDNSARYEGMTLQIPEDRHRHHYVKTKVRVHEYSDASLDIFHGPRYLARYGAHGTPINTEQRQVAWSASTLSARLPRWVHRGPLTPLRFASRASATRSSAGPPMDYRDNLHLDRQNRSTDVLPKPANSICYRHTAGSGAPRGRH